MTIEHRPTKASELPLVADPSSAELIGVLDGVAGRVPTAKIVEIVKEGASAYEVALKQGFEGTEQEWLDSLIGDLTDQARVEREAAEAAREGSQTARTGAEDARDGIQAALANIDGYDETLGRLSPAARRIVSAADVRAACVYNTTLDTDGGAWRRRVPGGFPSKALIIGRDASLTIYDADDPACPVHRTITRTSGASTTREFWRNGRAPTCLAAAEGMVAFGLATPAPAVGLCLIDLVQARVGRLSGGYDGGWSLPGVLDMLNTEGDDILSGVGAVLGSNSAVNHVAMRVAPGTRLDPNRCDLPMPTIAVGTDAGLSVVLPDGRVTNSVTGGIVSAVAFLGNGDLVWQISSNWGTQYTRRDQYLTTGFASAGVGQIGDVVAFRGVAPMGGSRFASWRGDAPGRLNLVDLRGFKQSGGSELVAEITDAFTTGYHLAAVNGAARKTPLIMSDSTADLSDIVEATPLDDDFEGYANTAEMLAAGWEDTSDETGGISWDDGDLVITRGTAGTYAKRQVDLVVGATYLLTVVTDAAGDNRLNIAIAATGGANYLSTTDAGAGATSKLTFVATAVDSTLSLSVFGTTAGHTNYVKSVLIQRIAADRSGLGTPAIVKGTFARVAVEPGAQLAALRGSLGAGLVVPGLPWGAMKERAIVLWQQPERRVEPRDCRVGLNVRDGQPPSGALGACIRVGRRRRGRNLPLRRAQLQHAVPPDLALPVAHGGDRPAQHRRGDMAARDLGRR